MNTWQRGVSGRKGSSRVPLVVVGALVLVSFGSPVRAAYARDALSVPAQGPSGDAFYTVPNPIPDGKPGDIVHWRQGFPMLNAFTARAWEIMYLSTNALGERNAVTGTVIVPDAADTATAPIVGFAVGTQGPAFECAPSKLMRKGLLYDQLAIDDSLANGYVVAVTDYEGYSQQGTPTYMTGQSMGPAVIDMVRAAQRLPAAHLSRAAKVVFQGYSQGGGAALWAAEKQPTYAPELRLVGAVGGGVPADLAKVAKGLDGAVGFGFLEFAALGLDAAYPDLNLDAYLTEAGRASARRLKGQCAVGLLVLEAFKRVSAIAAANLFEAPTWQARLAQNTLGSAPPKVPVLQYHALADEIVDRGQAEELRARYCAEGVQLQYRTLIADHLLGALTGTGMAHEWIVDRLNGAEAPSNC